MVNRSRAKPFRSVNVFSIILIGSSSLAACGGTWDLRDDTDTPESQMAIIEQHPTRRSPRIKTYRHLDLDIYKETSGSRHNTMGAKSRIRTPSGKIQLGTTYPGIPRIYYPEIEFTAGPANTYYLTWACIPYPFLAIVDSQETIVAIDSYCPDCNQFIGHTLRPQTECSSEFEPQWMKRNFNWFLEVGMQRYRNLCYAAEHGVASAMFRLSMLNYIGMYGIKEDHVRAYIWYRFGVNTDEEVIKNFHHYRHYLYKPKLSVNQKELAENLIEKWQPGQCEKDLLIMSEYYSALYYDGFSQPMYKIDVDGLDR